MPPNPVQVEAMSFSTRKTTVLDVDKNKKIVFSVILTDSRIGTRGQHELRCSLEAGLTVHALTVNAVIFRLRVQQSSTSSNLLCSGNHPT